MSGKFGKCIWLWTAMAVWICAAAAAGRPAAASRFTILIFTKTAGFRHDSIPAGIAAIRALGNEHGFTVINSEESSIFNDVDLAKYRVIVFLNTTGDILNSVEQSALETFIRGGGGFVGIHSATDTEYDWPWYGQLAGAYFQSHPAIQRAILKRLDSSDASTAAQWVKAIPLHGGMNTTVAARGTPRWATRRNRTRNRCSCRISSAASCGPQTRLFPIRNEIPFAPGISWLIRIPARSLRPQP